MTRRAIGFLAAGVGVGVIVLTLLLRPDPDRGLEAAHGDPTVPLEFEIVNPQTIPGLPVVVLVTVRNTTESACRVGDPSLVSDSLRLYIAEPGGTPSWMYSFSPQPIAGYQAEAKTLVLPAGGEIQRYFFVDPPPGEHEVWLEYAREPERMETTPRRFVATRNAPMVTDQIVAKILALAGAGPDQAPHALQELRQIFESGERAPVRVLALAGFGKIGGEKVAQETIWISENRDEPQSFRSGAYQLAARLCGHPLGPVRVCSRRPEGSPWD